MELANTTFRAHLSLSLSSDSHQERNTPIDEFVVKAEQLLTTNRVSTSLLDAMGHSLEIAWNDLLQIFQQRREVLDSNASFHEKIASSLNKMSALEVVCRNTEQSMDISTIQEHLNKVKQLRIEVLASVMVSLKEGNELLAKLRETAACGQLDTRPDSIKIEIKKSLTQVELWLEELHDRRNVLEQVWQSRKMQLEQCLALAILMRDLDELEHTLAANKYALDNANSALDTEVNVTHTMDEWDGIRHDSIAIRDRALKITRSTEKLANQRYFAAGDECCQRAYVFLHECTEHLEFIDLRYQLLAKIKEFYSKAEKAFTTLQRLETETSGSNATAHESSVQKQWVQRILNEIETLTEEPLRLGYALLDRIGRSNADAFAIEKTVAELESRKSFLEDLCTQNNDYLKITESLKEFYENCRDICAWLVSVNKAFLKTNNTLGPSFGDSKTFLKLYHQLLSDLEIKGTEINSLFVHTTTILESLDEVERKDVDHKVQSLHDTWNELKTIVENRVDAATNYLKFLQSAEKLTDMFAQVEGILRSTPDESKMSILDDAWSKIKPAYGQLKEDGNGFLDFVSTVSSRWLSSKVTERLSVVDWWRLHCGYFQSSRDFPFLNESTRKVTKPKQTK